MSWIATTTSTRAMTTTRKTTSRRVRPAHVDVDE